MISCCLLSAVRTVPGATDAMSAVAKAPKVSKPAYDYAKAMGEMPEVHDYEYIMPPTAPKTEQLSADELKVGWVLIACDWNHIVNCC